SSDIQPLLSRYRYLKAVAPLPGTLLSADVWVRPNTLADRDQAAAFSAIEQQWLTYWWQPEVEESLSALMQLSPRLLSSAAEDVATELPAAIVMPSAEQLEQSEFVEPLPSSAITSYDQLWRQLRGRK
ncbi:MAG: hypothetical protein AAF892_15315, partial [Cyanobacteria bacterium P01_D01_bin.71]